MPGAPAHLRSSGRLPGAPGELPRLLEIRIGMGQNGMEGHHNRQRLHSALGYRTPEQMERAAD